MPDGKQIRVSLPSDQAKLWATLCNYRIQAKQRLEASMNAVLTIRPLVGKAADPLSSDLKAIGRSLTTDSLDPRRETVRFREEPNFDDGWAHSEDNIRDGILRELNNMIANDRHEQLFAKFDEQEQQRAAKRKDDIDTRIAKRGEPEFRIADHPHERRRGAGAGRTVAGWWFAAHECA